MAHERIEQNPDILGGKPVIRGTRIPVDAILRLLGDGETVEGVLEAWPRLTEADIRAAQAFAADYLSGDAVFAAE